ncbi:MAG: hypothetical protein A3K19_15415 [Lentisphaerae bacterium RIFOXYB12_FULL_65_16]|nr:MAG: hypothetical protein A3K18_26530 [Lentisphaerae bacterium RIFOXYA12_64_32]OGV88488.1 MAG: hypothetical protein A3K19_15415 [Lentisphaerae bacterium RIFOXYB12_FULL_65_16]
MGSEYALTSAVPVSDCILVIRSQKVILDADLARLYGVPTRRLNEQVKRNIARFPPDFIFQLTSQEKNELVANCDRFRRLKHSTSLPHAFTEHGAIMAASVLNTPRAIQCSVFVVRAFVELRDTMAAHRKLATKLTALEQRLDRHDGEIQAILDAIRQLMAPPEPPQRKKIGFGVHEAPGIYRVRRRRRPSHQNG